jgi:hypothetical protein
VAPRELCRITGVEDLSAAALRGQDRLEGERPQL